MRSSLHQDLISRMHEFPRRTQIPKLGNHKLRSCSHSVVVGPAGLAISKKEAGLSPQGSDFGIELAAAGLKRIQGCDRKHIPEDPASVSGSHIPKDPAFSVVSFVFRTPLQTNHKSLHAQAEYPRP